MLSKEDWLLEALDVALFICTHQKEFITDAIWKELERRGIDHPEEPRWMGALINILKSNKIIIASSVTKTERGSRNSGYLTLWRVL